MLSDKELKELISAQTDTQERYWKGILYGEFSTWKTSTSYRCARNKVINLHADKGWHVYQNQPELYGDLEILPMEYQGLTQVKAVVEAVVSEQERFAGTDLLMLDTISQIQEKYVDFLGENFQIFGRESATPLPGSKEKAISLVGLPDYHLTRNKMRPVIDLLIQAPINVMFLAHAREPSPMEIQKGMLLRRPNVTDAVWKLLGRDATFIGHTFIKKGERFIDFEATNKLAAKSQIPALNGQIPSTQLPQILWDWQDRK